MKHLSLLVLMSLFALTVFTQPVDPRERIDSLEVLFAEAEPGFDKIDIWSGILRDAMFLGERPYFEETIARGKQLAEAYNDPSALVLAMILGENVIAFRYEGNSEKAVRLTKEALDLALTIDDPDLIAFARYQYAENLSYEKGAFAEAKNILEASIAEFDERVTLKNQGNTYKNLAYAQTQLGLNGEAVGNYERALATFEEVATNPDKHHRLDRVSAMYADGGINNVSQTLVYLGQAYQKVGNMEMALKTYQRGVDYCAKYGLDENRAWTMGHLAKLQALEGKYEEAISNLNTGIQIFEELGFEKDVVEFYQALGDIYLDLGEAQTALESFDKTYNYYDRVKDSLRIVQAVIRQSDAYLLQGNLEKALAVLEDVTPIATKSRVETNIVTLKKQKARVLSRQQKWDQAEPLLQDVLVYCQERERPNLEAETYYDLATIYFQQGLYPKAITTHQLSITLADTLNRIELQQENYEALSQAFAANGDYEAALTAYTTFHALTDSIYTTEAQEILREEQVRQNIQTFQQEKEAATLQAKLLQSRNQLYLIVALALLLLLVVGGYLFAQLRKTKQTLESKNRELEDLNATKDRFFGIIGHDLRSPLIALESVGNQMEYHLQKGNTDKLVDLSKLMDTTTHRLTGLLDNLLNWALTQQGALPNNPKPLHMRELSRQVLDMFALHAVNKQITLENAIPDDLRVQADDTGMRTILRNLISNAIKFTPQGGQVRLSAKKEGSHIQLRIKDTGIGIPKEGLEHLFELQKERKAGTDGERGTGLGLVLVKELTSLNQGELHIDSQEGKGTAFTVRLPAA
jgi:signal transduction histidine kinase